MKEQYRGKSLKTKEWVYGYYVESAKTGNDLIVTTVAGTMKNVTVDPKTVGRCTTLTDCKTGKPIYRDDMVEWSGGKGRVIWDEYMWNVQDFYYALQDHPKFAFSENREFKVIGNIHDSPTKWPVRKYV